MINLYDVKVGDEATLLCGTTGIVSHIQKVETNFMVKFNNSGTWLDYGTIGTYLGTPCDRMNIVKIKSS